MIARRYGRERRHHLNAVPIRLIYDRWVRKYTKAWAAGLVDLKHDLEDTMEKVLEIYIRTTAERLWEAITNREKRARHQFGAHGESTWASGSTHSVGSGNRSIRLSDVPQDRPSV